MNWKLVKITGTAGFIGLIPVSFIVGIDWLFVIGIIGTIYMMVDKHGKNSS